MKTSQNAMNEKDAIQEMIANQILDEDALSDKLVKWIDDPHRGKATATFGEGIERQIAIRFETLFVRLKTINKLDGSGPSEQTE